LARAEPRRCSASSSSARRCCRICDDLRRAFFIFPPPIVLGEDEGGGPQAVLNLCENRLCGESHSAIGRKINAEAPKGKTSGASALDPHLNPPPRQSGEEIRSDSY
jgi:hypothetical protein